MNKDQILAIGAKHSTELAHARAFSEDSFLACVEEIISAAPSAHKAEPWISVDDKLPEAMCLATYLNSYGNRRTIRAKYVARFTVEAQGDDCYSEYREDDDTEYLMPGWYECIDNWGEYSSVFVNEGAVTHWMPLPAAPSTAGEG
jgi:hypothetical protein